MIYTKVAKILSTTQVILAAGSEHGVQEGMQFIVYELSDEILDPETKESLGRLELVKGRVKASHVQATLTFATTLSREVVRSGSPFSKIFDDIHTTVYETLPVDESAITALKTQLKVRVGDLVRSIE